MEAEDVQRWVTSLAPGTTAEDGGVRLLGLPGGALVVGEGGRTLLWSPHSFPVDADADPADDELAGVLHDAALDGAVLPLPVDAPRRLGHQVALLRRLGALTDGAALATRADPARPPSARIGALLAAWGVAVLAPDAPTDAVFGAPAPALRSRTLVLGAAASGKSRVAEDLLAAEPDVLYVAPGPAPGPDDTDWAARVAAHRRRRPAWWGTVEAADLPALLADGDGPPLLLDSLGTWVTRALDSAGAWDDEPGWQGTYEREVEAMVAAWDGSRRRVVAVGEETGWGVVPATRAGGVFRDALGRLTQRLAESSHVLLVVAGRPIDLDALAPYAGGAR